MENAVSFSHSYIVYTLLQRVLWRTLILPKCSVKTKAKYISKIFHTIFFSSWSHCMLHGSSFKHLMSLSFTEEFFLPQQVLDIDNLVGVVQVENIMVFAESYDIAMDITFPKGLLTPSRNLCSEVTSFSEVYSLWKRRLVVVREEVEVQ